jgi:hypothetical protein
MKNFYYTLDIAILGFNKYDWYNINHVCNV